ncbi:MAG: glycosyltransferase family 2 protein [Chthoniobacterales bacterium]
MKSLFYFFNLPQRKLSTYFKNQTYRRWLARYKAKRSKQSQELLHELAAISSESLPTISVILPVCNPPLSFLQAAVASVQHQIWKHWELCIVDDGSTAHGILDYLKDLQKKEPRLKLAFHAEQQGIAATTNDALALASGEFVAFLDHDDLLAPEALAESILAITQHPDVGLLYSDEDKIDARGDRCDPFFKPDWNPDLLTSLNYCCHLSVLRRSLIIELGGIDTTVEGAQDWDLLLRATERLKATQIVHIPKILYHWRISRHSTAGSIKAKPHVTAASQRVLENHLRRIKRSFLNIENVHLGGHWHVNYTLPDPAPCVSIIIPNRDQKKLLQSCVESIQTKTDYPDYEILIADNDSQDLDLLAYYREQSSKKKIRVIKIPGPFNYSSINNRAVREARGEVLLLLNNDVEVIHPSWLHEMVSHAIRPEIGAVGALLYYPDGRIQHAGVVLGIAGSMKVNGVAGHIGKYFSGEEPVAGNRMRVVQNFSAVTGACLAVRKKLYEEVGGMDEQTLPVSFNDVDFCLKLHAAGYRNLWTPFAKLIHHESKSRKSDNTPAKRKRFRQEIAVMRTRWGSLLDNDPAYNPNLTLEHENWGLAWPPRI